MLHEKVYGRLNNASFHLHTPKISTSWSVEPVNITLYGKKDSADVVKLKGLEMGRLCWIIQVALIPNVLVRSRQREI